MASSGTYNFAAVNVDQLLDESFERAGISPPDIITFQQKQSARRSLNLILSEWMNNGLNLWTVARNQILTLNEGQLEYALPQGMVDVLELSLRKSVRQATGTPFASSGVAANAFDDNPATACIQNAPNGNIGIDYDSDKTILMLGVQSNIDAEYTLNFQRSIDNLNWTNVLSLSKQLFSAGDNQWFYMTAPKTGQYYRIVETGGATLNIQELYFNDTITDLLFEPISRYEYAAQVKKNTSGTPLTYCVNRDINPTVSFWPAPTKDFNAILYNAKKAIQDVGNSINSLEVPQRFFEAICCGLALKIATKYAPDRVGMLSEQYDKALSMASFEDVEKEIPLSFNFDFSGF